MRTTVDIPDETYKALKQLAIEENSSLKDVVLRAVQQHLTIRSARPVKRLQLPLIRSSQPGTLNLTNEQIEQILTDDLITS